MSLFAVAWVCFPSVAMCWRIFILRTAGYVIGAAIVSNMLAIVVFGLAVERDEQQLPRHKLLRQHLLLVLLLVLLCLWGAMLVFGSIQFL